MSEGIAATIYQTELYRIRSEVIDAKKDFIFNVPIVFPEGEDWKALNYEKIQIDDVEIEVKPYHNFSTMAGSGQGKISGDFPVYMTFYTGNTAGEETVMNFSKLLLTGRPARGTATTGVKVKYGAQYFKTVLSKVPETEGEIKSSIVNKTNDTNTIDDFNMESENVILQKGRVVVCVRHEDLMIKAKNLLTEGNSVSDGEQGNGNGNGASAILRHIKEKAGVKETVVEVKEKKRSRKNPKPDEPTDDQDELKDYLYPEDPITIGEGADAKKSLILDYPFWITATFHIHYWRKA